MRHRRNWPQRLLAGLLSATMLTLNVATTVPAYGASSAEAYREDAELVNDLAQMCIRDSARCSRKTIGTT